MDDASVVVLDLRSEPDRRSFERRSPTDRRSSSDRASTPLRRSLLDRRPAFVRLSSLVMLRFRWSWGMGLISTHATQFST
jgi:hypothetical protein